MYGYVKSPSDPRDWELRPYTWPWSYPKEFDVKGMANIPVFDQGSRGTCVSQATTGMKMWQEWYEKGQVVPLSREYLYYRCKQLDGLAEEGTFPRQAMKVLKNWGEPPEELCPYQKKSEWPETFITPALDEAARPNLIAGYSRITGLTALKGALMNYGPVVIGVPVYENWETDEVRMTGRVPRPAGEMIGGHALLVWGWTETHLKLRNSWSEDWGDKGNGLLPLDYPELWEDAWTAIDLTPGLRLVRGTSD